MDISIIGAGPIGCYTAYLLSKAGYNVSIFEEHTEIGFPVQCAGILTEEIAKLVHLDDSFLINKVKKAMIIAPSHQNIEINSNDVIVDRTKFDQYLAEMAEKTGVKIYKNYYFDSYDETNGFIRVRNKSTTKIKKIETHLLVGADGPNSKVRKLIHNKKTKFFLGKQARVKGNFDPTTYETYFGSVAPDSFAWVIPESKTIARIGLFSLTNPNYFLDIFFKYKNIKKEDILEYNAGLIPIYDPKQKVQRKNIYIVGDAALQVKATTGGGIVQGLQAAKILAKSIIRNQSYENNLKSLNKKLKMHLFLHKIRKKFKDKDYNKLIDLLNNKKIKKIFAENNRDNVLKLVTKVFFAEPRLVLFIRHLI